MSDNNNSSVHSDGNASALFVQSVESVIPQPSIEGLEILMKAFVKESRNNAIEMRKIKAKMDSNHSMSDSEPEVPKQLIIKKSPKRKAIKPLKVILKKFHVNEINQAQVRVSSIGGGPGKIAVSNLKSPVCVCLNIFID